MALTLEMRELLEAVDALRSLVTKPLPAKGSYQVSKIVRAVDKETEIFEAARRAAAERYKNQLAPLPDDATDEQRLERKQYVELLTAEINELLDAKVELEVSPVDWAFIENIEISPAHLGWLEPFLKMPE